MNEGKARTFLLEEMATATTLEQFDYAYKALENLKMLSLRAQGIIVPLDDRGSIDSEKLEKMAHVTRDMAGPFSAPLQSDEEKFPWE